MKFIKGELVARITSGKIKSEMIGFSKDNNADIIAVPKDALALLASFWPKDDKDNFIIFELPFRLLITKIKEIKKNTKREDDLTIIKPKKPIKLSSTAFGEDLADKFIKYLVKHKFFGESHRDYCGMGFKLMPTGQVHYGSIYDGHLDEAEKSFKDIKDFKKWLANQSDHSLSNHDKGSFLQNNQTITRERLSNLGVTR